jgi:ATP-dependent DNA helicase Rep
VLGLKEKFSILDTDDITGILKDCAGGTTDANTARQWQWTISGWKNAGLDADQALAQAVTEDERATAVLMARYQERLSAYQAVDFDDLISLPLKLLQDHPAVRERWQQQMGHVLVDEYQDTNATQYELLKLLVGERARFTAVGDDDQSIYGWRGATLENLKKLPVDYPALKVIALEQNYRSTSAILRAANNVIGPNPKLYPKKLWSDLGEGEPVRVIAADNEDHEAERVAARIQSIRAGNGPLSSPHKEFRDFCVLYRANHQAKVFEQALRKAQIPVQSVGRHQLFRPGRNPRPVRLAAPAGQQQRRPRLPARHHHAQARRGAPDAGGAGRVCGQVQAQPVRGLVFALLARRAACTCGRQFA